MDDQNRRPDHGRRRPMDVDQNRWSEQLPDELLEMIVKRLTLVDSIRFAAVCPSWRRVSSQWFQRVTTRLPWLLTSARFLDSYTTVIYSFYSPSENAVYKLKFPRESSASASRSSITNMGIRCSGSIDGWLIMSEWTRERRSTSAPRKRTFINYFFNPITGDRIKLPELVGNMIPYISTASSNPRCSDCVVAFIQSNSQLVFCMPSSDKSWLWKEQQESRFCIGYIKFHEDGKLYVFETDKIVVLDLVLKCQGKGRCDKIITAYTEKTISAGAPPVRSWYPTILWSSKGELLLMICENQVLKRDGKSGQIWVNLEPDDIAEDVVVLVSSTNNTSVAKSRSNSVLNTIDEAFLQLWCGKFFTCPKDISNQTHLSAGFWITPDTTR